MEIGMKVRAWITTFDFTMAGVWFILWLECGKDYTMAYSISHKLYIIV